MWFGEGVAGDAAPLIGCRRPGSGPALGRAVCRGLSVVYANVCSTVRTDPRGARSTVSLAQIGVEFGGSSGPPDGPGESFDRTPPQDVLAEQSVLGGMMLSKDAIADVVETVRGADFYRPAHETIFEAVLDLYGRGEPADAVTVADELTKRGHLARIGGAAYLHTLISGVPTAANAGYYAQIVRERAVLRRLVEAGTRIVQLGYATDGGDVDDLVNAAQAEVYAVTERRTSEDYLPIGQIIEGTVDEIEAAGHRDGVMAGVPTGFADLDRLTHGLHPGQMIVLAARPALGKSTLGLDIARSASIKHAMTSVIFSLEMSRTEITMRLLSAEARIPLQKLRQGKLDDSDWTKMARTMGELTDAPLFIDDSPNMSLMEIRAKCRRLKQRHDLKLVIIDYLQLMQSHKRVESRQQEVSEFSRALKLLAKELEVPVIAISQLNRGPEGRTDKRPMMSDLRESGCLPAQTRVLRADTGAETTLGALYAAGARDVPVWSLDDSLRYVRRHLTHVFPTGTKPVFRVELASGKTVRATANHPFLTYEGWAPLESLWPGTRVAVPRHVPAPESMTRWDDSKVTAAAETLAEELQGVGATALGVPAPVACLPKQQIAMFLRHTWSIAGSVRLDESGDRGRVRMHGVRRVGLDNVARLLLRFGISTSVRRVEPMAPTSPADGRIGAADWELSIDGVDDQRRFLGEIGVYGECSLDAMMLLDVVRAASAPEPAAEQASQQVWHTVHEVLLAEAEELALVGAAGAGSASTSGRPVTARRTALGQVTEVLELADLEVDAVNDVLWDRVLAIEPDGVEQVFDATVIGTHNFVADGIAVHNSIEQDADMVILLHREDAYERESPRAGEADFIVAKHRNGPTDTITVAFQGHYSRFVDMAAT
ncbi:MAG: replicative DNA helicase [Actinomycetales bacterium]